MAQQPPSPSQYSASPIFPYSTARPPTSYSTYSWAQPTSTPGRGGRRHGRHRSSVPLMPTRHIAGPGGERAAPLDAPSPVTSAGMPTAGGAYETPLYARSSWNTSPGRGQALPSAPPIKGPSAGGRREGGHSRAASWTEAPTAWSRSSYAPGPGPQTARSAMSLRTPRMETVYEDGAAYAGRPGDEGLGYYRDDVPMTAPYPASTYTADTRYDAAHGGPELGVYDDPFAEPGQRGQGGHLRHRSDTDSFPSVMDLGHLAGADHSNVYTPRTGVPTPHAVDRDILTLAGGGQGPALLSPSRLHQLGRMSVDPAQYTITDQPGYENTNHNPYRNPLLGWQPPAQNDTLRALGVDADGGAGAPSWLIKLRSTSAGVVYMSYRPYIWTLATFTAAMSLTLAVMGAGTAGTAWGTILEMRPEAMAQMPPESGDGVGLGVWGWCSLGEKSYSSSAFVSSLKRFRIPDDSNLLVNLSYLLTAQTTLTYLLAAFHLVTAFLHFFLIFGLSLPFDQFYSGDPLPPLTGVTGGWKRPAGHGTRVVTMRDVVQAEVDIRVRCERPPYETYLWVWWAWWGHRRGPLGHLLAVVCGLLGMCTLGVSIQFYRTVSSAAEPGSVSFGAGSLVALFAFLMTIDPFVTGVAYAVHGKTNFLRFMHPPLPKTVTLRLPARKEKQAVQEAAYENAFYLGQ